MSSVKSANENMQRGDVIMWWTLEEREEGLRNI